MRIVLMVSLIVASISEALGDEWDVEENLRGLEPDVAILAENSNYDWTEAIKILRPKTVIIHHYDNWRVPLASGMTGAVRRRAQRMEREVKSIDGNIKVIIPEFLKTITLE